MIEKLLNQVRKKKRKAQERFYMRYSKQLFLVSYRYVSNELDAGSIVNMSFFKIFKHLDNFDYINEQKLIAWMKRIVINEALGFIRSQAAFVPLPESNFDLPSSDLPDRNLLLEDYYCAIKALPSDLRTVFNMYVIDGYSHKEIAQAVEIKESSSRVYLTRARNLLKEKLSSPNSVSKLN